ncbi:Stage III sporulation protein E [uncultured Clostridium sp.]|uniref:FtsK/SpoIIIE family DNA translocase n=1 Tax=uncultured Clostridium sp. TaxID=59620 RepID=UPI000822BFD7|nr:DNA translocase FtsK [uncultured Clostridium sp.]SCK04372.1 Stage III sporulation protein E [uncultured Clostridium sp.]
MTTKSKKNIKKRTKKKKTLDSDIKSIVYIVIGLLLTIAIYTNLAGALSHISRKYIYNLIGLGAFILPLYLIYFGINMIISKGEIVYSRRLFGITLIVITLIFLSATINIQSLSEETFKSSLKLTMEESNLTLHGGFLGHLITFPISRLIGYVGSYILYSSLLFIGIMQIFDIKIYSIVEVVNKFISKIVQNIKSQPKKKDRPNKANEQFIEVETINDVIDKDIVKGIDNKIQILDFMKNSSSNESDISEELSLESFNAKEGIEFMNTDKQANTESIQNIGTSKNFKSKEIDLENIINSDSKEIHYIFPTIDLLKNNGKARLKSEDKKDLIDGANKLESILESFGVEAKVTQVTKGPSVTRFELQPSPGVKVSKIVNLTDDIALGLAANGIRIEAPIPGKSAIGIEVPNRKQIPVFLREVLDSKEFTNSNKKLSFGLGKDIAGKCVVGDLSKMPHMLIAGATGSGKSVCINALIISLIYKYSPADVKLLMVDPKVVELSVYNDIPHLLIPVVTDPKKAAGALNWAVNEMNKRYNLFYNNKVKNIESYNNLFDKGEIDEKLPYIVIIVDELADLMMACPHDVEDYICRLAQMARAAGMHLIIATQRPSVDVITGVIKANIPSRISFAVSSGIDSRTILDQVGAEKLLGRGDMLYYPIGENKPVRVQGAFISEEEVENVVNFIKTSQYTVTYEEDIINHINSEIPVESQQNEYEDELLEEAIKIVIEYQQASTSFLQRKLRIGFNRASRIMDMLEEQRIISPKDGSRPRQVLVVNNE